MTCHRSCTRTVDQFKKTCKHWIPLLTFLLPLTSVTVLKICPLSSELYSREKCVTQYSSVREPCSTTFVTLYGPSEEIQMHFASKIHNHILIMKEWITPGEKYLNSKMTEYTEIHIYLWNTSNKIRIKITDSWYEYLITWQTKRFVHFHLPSQYKLALVGQEILKH